MSLVGTRPPTVDEWDKYELHHRARLATKPGLTGMWQVSGRSNITDFNDVTQVLSELLGASNFSFQKKKGQSIIIYFKADSKIALTFQEKYDKFKSQKGSIEA